MAHDDRPDSNPTTLSNLRDLLPHFDFVQRISLYDQTKASLKSRTIPTDVVVSEDFGPTTEGVGTTNCVEYEAVDVAGQAQTDDEGKMTWRLTDFICAGTDRKVEGPASFVATPITMEPTYLTTRIVIPNQADDLIVHVFTWDSSGSPAARIRFSWRCRVRYSETFIE